MIKFLLIIIFTFSPPDEEPITYELVNQVDSFENCLNFTNYLKLSESAAIYSDALPVPQADPNGRPGWLHTKPVANTDKINYYVHLIVRY